jgi:carboxyl-terminal processing protease
MIKKSLDKDTTGWSLTEAVSNIRGERGSEVILTLYRQDKGEPFQVTLKRDEIIVKSVELEFVEHAGKRVAHMSLLRFGERTTVEWEEAVAKVLAEGSKVNGVVLDMRNNPGGFFDGAIDISSEFVASGTVVIQKGKYTQQEFPAKGQARLTKMPVVVLVNRGSASASEIVAGALKDRRNAKLVGEKTFGKGTVQDRRELSNGGGLHVTIAEWLTPNGDSIHDVGIPVSVEVTNNPDTPEDEMVLKAVESL